MLMKTVMLPVSIVMTTMTASIRGLTKCATGSTIPVTRPKPMGMMSVLAIAVAQSPLARNVAILVSAERATGIVMDHSNASAPVSTVMVSVSLVGSAVMPAIAEAETTRVLTTLVNVMA